MENKIVNDIYVSYSAVSTSENNAKHKPEDQWSCKRSSDIWALNIYMMLCINQGNLIYLN